MSNPKLPGNLMPLPEALRALPQVAPERSAWAQLADELSAASSRGPNVVNGPAPGTTVRASRRRWFVPASLAAGIVLAFAAMAMLHRNEPHAPAVATVAPPAASNNTNVAITTNVSAQQSTHPALAANTGTQLQLLQQHSQALEHWLRETGRAAGPLPGQDLAAATEIEDMIGLIDVQLGSSARDADLALWRRRVALLEDLTALRYSRYSLAEAGADAKSLTPTTWTN